MAAGVVATLLTVFLAGDSTRVEADQWEVSPGLHDSTFIPLTPCRLVDTRQVGDEPFGAGETRTYSGLESRGDCLLFIPAVGLSLNVTAVGATHDTWNAFWPSDRPMPTASVLNPAPGQPPTPNAVVVGLSPSGEFSVFNYSGTVDLIIDVNGLYMQSTLNGVDKRLRALEMWAKVDADDDDATLLDGFGVSDAYYVAPGLYEVTFFESIVGCGWFATLNDNDAGIASPGEIAIERGSLTATHSLYIRTFDSAGTQRSPSESQGFSVRVVCSEDLLYS